MAAIGNQNYHMSSFEKIVSILNLFNIEKFEYSLNEIRESLDINLPTLYRLLSNLIQHGLLEKNSVTKRYRLGPLLIRLGFIATNNYELRVITEPILKAIALSTGQTVHLSQKVGKEIVILERHDGSDSLGVKSTPGMTRPLHSTASGKLLFSYLTEDEILEILPSIDFIRYTENTITDPDVFLSELTKIRQQGYAFDNREHNVDVCCIAVPVWSPAETVISCISVSGPYFYFNPENTSKYLRAAREASRRITAKLSEMGIYPQNAVL